MTHAHMRLPRQALVDYFRNAFKPRERWRVGIEVEKSGLDARTRQPIPFRRDGAAVEAVLRSLLDERGGSPVYEGDSLIGIEAPWGAISLEPGGQVEWSSRPRSSLDVLEADLHDHLAALDNAGAALGVRWLDVALHPDAAVSEMPWMPKARYAIMRDYLGARGTLSRRMMTQTLSIQCAFDFEDDADWTRKFRAAALTAPVAAALFANSERVDGRPSGWRSYRHAIWKDTDPDRCGLPPVVFDDGFGIEAWVDFALAVPTIFTRSGNGLVPSSGTPFGRLLEREGCDAVTIADWELHLSTLFTEVRSYTYLETRSADLQPDDLIMAVPAFWTGLLYHPEALGEALQLGAGHDAYAAWRAALDTAAKVGLDGTTGAGSLREQARRALGLAAWSLRNGATCAGAAVDPAAPLERLAARHGFDLREHAP